MTVAVRQVVSVLLSLDASSSPDPIAAYRADLDHHPRLDADEEHALALRLFERGDARAFAKLVEGNLRLVLKVAARYRGLAPQSDLVQEGNLGLIHAVRKFDPSRGVRLSTYAVWWIRAYILRFLERNRSLVRVTTTRARSRIFYRLSRTRQALLAQGLEPTAERIAEVLCVAVGEVEVMLQAMRPDLRLDAPAPGTDDDAGSSLLDRVAHEDETPATQLEEAEMGEVLRDKLEQYCTRLRGREAELFTDRLLRDDPIPLQELGERWGVTREAARRLELRVLGPLRRFLVRELGDAVPEPLRRRARPRRVTAFAM